MTPEAPPKTAGVCDMGHTDSDWCHIYEHPMAHDDCISRDDFQDATAIILAFYNRAKDLGWTTPEMADARAFLRQYARNEVWS